jgi:RNA polymerase sigma factor (sigma-70 family)
MQAKSDTQLLRDYAARGDEAAFRELVTRHTDFVFSAALRQVESSAVAGDLTQSVFTDLARKTAAVAEKFSADASLAGWLHRSTRYAALNHLRDTQRRRTNERLAMEQLLTNSESDPDWEQIRPALDEALDSLGDADREVLLLRFFQKKDFRAVGLALGVSDDTAQKRVSRAVEQLREFFAKRKITVGAGGLVAAISANAVQAAPAGLAVTVTTVALSATALTTTLITTTKTIVMTTLQKALVTATVAVLLGAGIYEARQAAQLREKVQALQQQQTPLAEQLQKLERQHEAATNQVAGLVEELAKAKKNPSEVLKLRGQVGALQQEKAITGSKSAINKITANPESRKALRDQQKMGMSGIYSELAKDLKLSPGQTAQFNDLLADHVMDNIDLITQALRDKNSPAEIDQIFAARESALQSKLLGLVGEEGLAKYQDYTKDLASTLTASQFAATLTGDKAATAEKQNQLLLALQAATKSTLAANGLPADYQLVPTLNFRNLASEEVGRQNLNLLDSIYAQVAAHSSAFLTPDELNQFQTFRTNAIKLNTTMLMMNRTLMAPISQ